ncbi:MAG: hypothetical protein EPN62_08735 [Candidimonas sp.]|nr:MAG: hypothetical protein EPN77_05970 [Candidimonas sp.]TAM23752.1 MAG: hypothetical protein EPN62_08735 [Candidimonas sp.]
MSVIMKVGAVTFTHSDSFTGDVEIRRGDTVVKVPVDTLKKLVGECVRHETILRLENVKPADLLTLLRN